MNREVEEFLVNLHKNKEPDEWIQIEIKTLHEMIEKGKQQERERIIGEIEKIRDCPHCNTKQQATNLTLN